MDPPNEPNVIHLQFQNQEWHENELVELRRKLENRLVSKGMGQALQWLRRTYEVKGKGKVNSHGVIIIILP
jgi:hypothetical protein